MLYDERKSKILEMLEGKKFVSVEDIRTKLFVSKATVRRDLIDLENEKLIIRVRGGAMLNPSSMYETTYAARETIHITEKKSIANLASTFIQEGNSIFLDASTTVEMIVPFLMDFKRLTVITNGMNLAREISDKTANRVILIGGDVIAGSSSTQSLVTSDLLNDYHVNLAILSCRGIDPDGVYEANDAQGKIKQIMIRNSSQSLLMCDSSKFNKTYFYRVALVSEYNYILTEKLPSEIVLADYVKNGAVIIES